VLDYFDVQKARVMRVINPKSKELVVNKVCASGEAKFQSPPCRPSLAIHCGTAGWLALLYKLPD
jgi:hypothetical protein